MKKRDTQSGAALLTVLGIISIMVIVSTMLAYTAQQQTRSSIITRDMLKARMIAESGLNKAYHAIKDDFSKAEGYALSENFDDGSYKVLCKTFSGEKENRAQLTASGACGLGSVIVGADLENIPIVIPEDGEDDTYYSTDFDILTGGVMNISGNFYGGVTAFHANGNADFSGSSSVADGATISSAGTVDWGNNKRIPENVVLQPSQANRDIFPDGMQRAVEDFINLAENNDQVYASGAAIPANPAGGVVIYTGPDKLILDGNFNACIIVLGGEVVVNSQTSVTGPGGYPSLISLSPDIITVNGGSVLRGAILAPNSAMKFNGGGEVHGPLLVGQGLTGNGTADLYAGDGQGFTLPPKEVTEDNVIITAWH